MFQLQRAIIRPQAEHGSVTFSDCAVYVIPYRLHAVTVTNKNCGAVSFGRLIKD